jgi:hypothetical protein
VHEFEIVPPLNLIVFHYGSFVDDRSLMKTLLSAYDHPDFVPGMDELVSFLETRQVDVTSDGLRQIARTWPHHPHRGREQPNLVAVVTNSKLGYGLSRLYGTNVEQVTNVTLDIFPSVEAGSAWLDERRGRPLGSTQAAAERAMS